MTIVLRCRLCRGTGEVPNEQFRICQELRSHEVKKYFHMQADDLQNSDDEIPPDACNGIPERIPCPACEGSGTLEFDEEEWDLQIVSGDEEEGVE